jgi:pimeloyl-ACP methyl ester carboxylesterase
MPAILQHARAAATARSAPSSWRARRAHRVVPAACLLAGLLAFASPAAAQEPAGWRPCGGAGAECAAFSVPLDHARPEQGQLRLALARVHATDPARRIGSLFFNLGGPGAPAVEILREAGTDLFPTLSDRFDIVAVDPRGVGESERAIACGRNQETQGLYAQPFPTPQNLRAIRYVARAQRLVRRCVRRNRAILPYVATANVARDIDLIRAALGEERLTFVGFSYGTFLGATYASLFPDRYRALVLDGAVDADRYINRPVDLLREQSASVERALGRFFRVCAARRRACGFGAGRPRRAFDALVARLNDSPARTGGRRVVDGEDVLVAAAQAVYAKQFWPILAEALDDLEAGNAELARLLADAFYGRDPDGSYGPMVSRYFTISAVEQRYPRGVRRYLGLGRRCRARFAHFWWNCGYAELPFALMPVEPRGAFYGPFEVPATAVPPLVIGTTNDPATPYRGSRRLVRDLGNARLLTMRGDGHTAYPGNSGCVDAAVDAYLEDGVLPPPGTVCRQRVPFASARALVATAGRPMSSHLPPGL